MLLRISGIYFAPIMVSDIDVYVTAINYVTFNYFGLKTPCNKGSIVNIIHKKMIKKQNGGYKKTLKKLNKKKYKSKKF